MIEERGGTWKQQYGVDGEINGRPVEARVAKKDDRFRLGKSVHQTLVREGGSYLFDKIGDGKPPKRVPASEVDRKMGGGKWLEDRSYPHRFLPVDDVFGSTGGREPTELERGDPAPEPEPMPMDELPSLEPPSMGLREDRT